MKMWVLHTAFLAIFLFSFSIASELKQQSDVCPVINVGQNKVVCYYEGRKQVKDVYVCGCTHIVYTGNLNVQNLEDVSKDLLKKQPNLKFILRVTGKEKNLVKLMKSRHYHGVELYNTHTELDRTRVLNNVKAVKSTIGTQPILMLSLPAVSELLAKYYDMKHLQKVVDVFVLETHSLGDVHHVTFHPSRLSGLWDMMNMDSTVDLVVGLGVPAEKIVVLSPAIAYLFTLSNTVLNTPSSPTLGRPGTMNQEELCNMIKVGNWTLERDQDLSAPYTFQDKKWIAFEDTSSLDVKSKYARVRGLAGHGLIYIDDDHNTECEGRLLDHVVKSLSSQVRAPRKAVLGSLKNEILSIPQNQFWSESVLLSPYRITRVVDADGIVHPIREDTRTEFECQRQGYFVHPRTCNRFYRCVKYDQQSDEFTVFEFDCPSGLEFDSRYEVCVWPGSLDSGQACPGSSEIAPVPQTRFICPAKEGYYADPENCRWFFACLDHGKQVLTAYEFRCPFGLGFDESRLICDWPWLIPACGDVGKYESTLYDHGHNRNAIILNGPSAFIGNTADSINVAGYESLLSGAQYNNYIGIQSVQSRINVIEGSSTPANGHYQVDINDRQPYNDYNTVINPESRGQHIKENVFNVYPNVFLNHSQGVNGMSYDNMNNDDVYKYAVHTTNNLQGIHQNTQYLNLAPGGKYEVNAYNQRQPAINVNSEQQILPASYEQGYKINTVATNKQNNPPNYVNSEEFKEKTNYPEQNYYSQQNSGEFLGNIQSFRINKVPSVNIETQTAHIKYNPTGNIQISTNNLNGQNQQLLINPYYERDSVNGGNVHFGFVNPPVHNIDIQRFQYEPIKQNRSYEYSQMIGEQLAAGAINSGLIGTTRQVNVGELQHIQDMSRQAIQSYLSSYHTRPVEGILQPTASQLSYPQGFAIHRTSLNLQPSYPTQQTVLGFSQPAVQLPVPSTPVYPSPDSTIRAPLSTHTYEQSGPVISNKVPFNYHEVDVKHLNYKPHIYPAQEEYGTRTITYPNIIEDKTKTPTNIINTGSVYQHSLEQINNGLPSAAPTPTVIQHTISTQYIPTSSNIHLIPTTEATLFESQTNVLPNTPQVTYPTLKHDLNIEINSDHISKPINNPTITTFDYNDYDSSQQHHLGSVHKTIGGLKQGVENIKIPHITHYETQYVQQPNHISKPIINPTTTTLDYKDYDSSPQYHIGSVHNTIGKLKQDVENIKIPHITHYETQYVQQPIAKVHNIPPIPPIPTISTIPTISASSYGIHSTIPTEVVDTHYNSQNIPEYNPTYYDINANINKPENSFNVRPSQSSREGLYSTNIKLDKSGIINTGIDVASKLINQQNDYYNYNLDQPSGEAGYTFTTHSTEKSIDLDKNKSNGPGVIQYDIHYDKQPQDGYFNYKSEGNTNANAYPSSLNGGNIELQKTVNSYGGINLQNKGENIKYDLEKQIIKDYGTFQPSGGNSNYQFGFHHYQNVGGINTGNMKKQESTNNGYDIKVALPDGGINTQSKDFGISSTQTSGAGYNINGFISNGYQSSAEANINQGSGFLINGGNYPSQSSVEGNYEPSNSGETNININNVKKLIQIKGGNLNKQGSAATTSQTQKYYGKISFDGHVEVTNDANNKPSIAIVTKLNDYNPLIVSKLGAQCSCCNARRIKLRSRTSTTQNDDSEEEFDDEETAIEYDEDNIPYYNGEEELSKTNDSTVIHKPTIIVSSTLSPIIVEDEDIEQRNESKNIQPIVVEERSSKRKQKKKAQKRVKQIKDEEGEETEDSDSTKGIECKREGLFRHPKNCNKFYSCSWDSFKKKHVLHEFRCPIQLSFDHKMGACNWPSQGPACQSNTLLPSRY